MWSNSSSYSSKKRAQHWYVKIPRTRQFLLNFHTWLKIHTIASGRRSGIYWLVPSLITRNINKSSSVFPEGLAHTLFVRYVSGRGISAKFLQHRTIIGTNFNYSNEKFLRVLRKSRILEYPNNRNEILTPKILEKSRRLSKIAERRTEEKIRIPMTLVRPSQRKQANKIN